MADGIPTNAVGWLKRAAAARASSPAVGTSVVAPGAGSPGAAAAAAPTVKLSVPFSECPSVLAFFEQAGAGFKQCCRPSTSAEAEE